MIFNAYPTILEYNPPSALRPPPSALRPPIFFAIFALTLLLAAMACGGDSGDAPAATEVARATSVAAAPTAAAPTRAATRPATLSTVRSTEPKPATPATDRPTPTPAPTTAVVLPTPTPARPTPTPGPTLRPLLDKTSARTDREALNAFNYEASIAGWGGDNPLGEWPGVVTDSNGRVTEIELEVFESWGRWDEIPWELGNLTNLEVLRLRLLNGHEILEGGIPPELSNLANLRVLRITGAVYFGNASLPPLGNLTNLEELCISGLQGGERPIPPELGNLVNLEVLCIGADRDEIPPELGNLVNLKELYLYSYSDQLTGEIPPELGNLVNLETLAISGKYEGKIPPELGNLANLETLVITWGSYEGAIPPELGNLAKLKFLNIPGDLNGCVPHGLRDQLSSPTDQDFPWSLPWEWDWISGESRRFCADPEIVAEQMSVLTALYDGTDGDNWYDNTNWLSDAPLGEWYGVATDSDGYITRLMLYENDLSGGIPAELGNLANLQSLYLYGNNLTGCIPAKLRDQLTDTELGGLSYCGQ